MNSRRTWNTESMNSFITLNTLSVLSQLAEGDALFKELRDMVTSAADGGFLIHWGRATDTHVIKSATVGTRSRAKLSTSQIYTNGPLLFAGYNTAAQFVADLRVDKEKQMQWDVSNQAHSTNLVCHCNFLISNTVFVFFFFHYSHKLKTARTNLMSCVDERTGRKRR